MRVEWENRDNSLRVTLFPDGEDALLSRRSPGLRMMTNNATVRFPWPMADPHPDLLAIAAYSIAWPWVQRRMRFDRPISDDLAAAFTSFGIDASYAGSESIPSRRPGNRISLAYSGGSDSIATSELLPEDTAYVHLRRVKHPRVVNRMTHVRVDVLEALVRRAANLGRDVTIVQTDLEYVCLPYATYPVWWAISIASILTADKVGAGGIAMGTVLEARYTANGTRWSGASSDTYTHRLYSAAGIPIVRPVAGMTEVGTTRLSMESDLGQYSRSCLLGTLASPCLNCDKCLRKEMTMAAVTGSTLSKKLLENMKANPGMLSKILAEPPIYFQDMVEYSLARIDVSGTPLQPVKDRLQPTVEDTTWAEHYYRPALIDEVPEAYRLEVEKKLRARIDFMTPEETRIVETWDAKSRDANTSARKARVSVDAQQ